MCMKGTRFVVNSVGDEVESVFRRSHWFHTIMITRGELEKVFANGAMKHRFVSARLVAVSRNSLVIVVQNISPSYAGYGARALV